MDRLPPEPQASLQVVVMGVSGCGKTTLSRALGQALGLDVVDGDDLHLPQSVAKMRAGQPLQDEDRWPWLDRIGQYLARGRPDAASQGRVVACSALKRAYRDRIRSLAPRVCFLFLDGDAGLILRRMQQRQGHYMQPGLLDSQIRTLEHPQPDETDVFRLDLSLPVDELVHQARQALREASPVS